MNPALADYWTGLDPVQDYAAQAMAHLADKVKEEKHPETYRYVVGLRPGWEDALAASREDVED